MRREQGGTSRPGTGPSSGDLGARLHPVIEGALRPLGFDLDELDVQQAGKRKVLKVVVDAESGIGLDEVAEATRLVSAALDDADEVLAGPYTLEVTSPGVDRPLTLRRHWQRARFRQVRVRTGDGTEFLGRIGDCDDDGVDLLRDGAVRRHAYAEIANAVVEVEFRQPPAAELAALRREPSDVDGTPEDARTAAEKVAEKKEESR